MKRIILTLLFLICHLAMSAQSGLSMNALFEGQIVRQERMVETRVRGRTLRPYQLTFYRSLRFTATEEETKKLRKLMEEDIDRSIDGRSMSDNTKKAEPAYTCKLQMASADGKNRFLCYQEKQKHPDSFEVTVIYMEGSIGSLKNLESLLNNK